MLLLLLQEDELWEFLQQRELGCSQKEKRCGAATPEMIWGEKMYHRLAAFAGDWAQWETEENQG